MANKTQTSGPAADKTTTKGRSKSAPTKGQAKTARTKVAAKATRQTAQTAKTVKPAESKKVALPKTATKTTTPAKTTQQVAANSFAVVGSNLEAIETCRQLLLRANETGESVSVKLFDDGLKNLENREVFIRTSFPSSRDFAKFMEINLEKHTLPKTALFDSSKIYHIFSSIPKIPKFSIHHHPLSPKFFQSRLKKYNLKMKNAQRRIEKHLTKKQFHRVSEFLNSLRLISLSRRTAHNYFTRRQMPRKFYSKILEPIISDSFFNDANTSALAAFESLSQFFHSELFEKCEIQNDSAFQFGVNKLKEISGNSTFEYIKDEKISKVRDNCEYASVISHRKEYLFSKVFVASQIENILASKGNSNETMIETKRANYEISKSDNGNVYITKINGVINDDYYKLAKNLNKKKKEGLVEFSKVIARPNCDLQFTSVERHGNDQYIFNSTRKLSYELIAQMFKKFSVTEEICENNKLQKYAPCDPVKSKVDFFLSDNVIYSSAISRFAPSFDLALLGIKSAINTVL